MAYNEDLTTPATGDAAMKRFKDRAVLANWSVAASGDGIVAYGAASDVITADSGANSFATDGAWLRLKMNGATREYLFTRRANSRTWTVEYSAAGFVGGAPSATVAPTATDSVTLWSNATLLPADGTYRWLVCAEDAAPYYLGVASIPSGGGAAFTAILHLPLRSGSYPVADTQPYVVVVDGHADCCSTSRVGFVVVGAGSGITMGRVGSDWRACPLVEPRTNNGNVTIAGTPVSPISGEELPLEVLSLVYDTNTPLGPKGYLRDARYVLSSVASIANGTHLEDPAGRYWYRLRDLWLPWGATPPAL